jgi:ABC-2 type transport system ATP-binding protein
MEGKSVMAQTVPTTEAGTVLKTEMIQSTAESIIEIDKLEKQYKGSPVKAVNQISFSVKRGEIFGLLGPNGAGKTSTISILTTRSLPTGGRVVLAGADVVADPVSVKKSIAVVPQRNNLDRSLTAIENLTFHAAYFGAKRKQRRERAMALLKELGLADRAKERVDTYSGGLQQRLLIARALMHVPGILFLDEPTVGLDPQSRLFLWDVIEKLNRNGLTIFLTTHDMAEAQRLCHRVAVMDRGKILALDTPKNLSTLIPSGTRIELRIRLNPQSPLSDEVKNAILAEVRALPGVTSAEWTTVSAKFAQPSDLAGIPGLPPEALSGNARVVVMQVPVPVRRPDRPDNDAGGPEEVSTDGGRKMVRRVTRRAGEGPEAPPSDELMLRLYAERGGQLAVEAARCILDRGLSLSDLHLSEPSLEDVFIHLTGRGLRN